MENEEKTGSGTGLAIFALVVGIIALLFSFIPCLGAFAIYVAPVSLLISAIAFFIQNSSNQPTGLAIGAILISLLASGIAFYQAYQIHHFNQKMEQFQSDMRKDIQSVVSPDNSQQQQSNNQNATNVISFDSTFIASQSYFLGKWDVDIRKYYEQRNCNLKTGNTNDGSWNINITSETGTIVFVFHGEDRCNSVLFYPGNNGILSFYVDYFNRNYGSTNQNNTRWIKPDKTVVIDEITPADGNFYFRWSKMEEVVNSNNPVATPTVTDIDGNVYQTVQIGTQVWMKENLKTTHFRDNTAIPEVEDVTSWGNILKTNAQTAAWCCAQSDISNNSTYGKLYNWYAVKSSHQLCPPGWHVPTLADWIVLSNYLGGESACVAHLRDNTHWQSETDPPADNSSGFTAVPGGDRDGNGVFENFGRSGFFWTCTPDDNYGAWSFIVGNFSMKNDDSKEHAFSVRLIKD